MRFALNSKTGLLHEILSKLVSYGVNCASFLGLVILCLNWNGVAHASSHEVKGCLTIRDDRHYADENSPTYGQYVPVVDAPIPVYATNSSGVKFDLGDLTTNSSGCFSGTATGIFIPDDTTISLELELEDSPFSIIGGYRVYDSKGTWVYSLGSMTVAAGEDADFGTIYAASSDSNGAVMLWVTAHDAVDFHDKRFGSNSFSAYLYPTLKVYFPKSQSPSNTNDDRIAMTQGAYNQYNTFLHEFGHWIVANDVSSDGDLGGYCQSIHKTNYPYGRNPYGYVDPGAATGDCEWEGESYETGMRALSEAHANYIAQILWSGACQESMESFDLNFDGTDRVQNVAHALCDLTDSGKETVGVLHTYGNPKHIKMATPSVALKPVGSLGGTQAYGTDGTKIYAVDYATGAMTVIFDMASFSATVDRVSSDGGYLCAVSTTGGLYCGKASGKNMTKQTLPTSMSGVEDVFISGKTLYVIGRVLSEYQVYVGELALTGSGGKFALIGSIKVEAQNWQQVYGETYTGAELAPQMITVNDAQTRLYIARKHWVEVCSLLKSKSSSSVPYCGNDKTADFAGNRTYAGYSRGAPTSSYLYNIAQLNIAGGQLYIIDDYGVARINLSAPTTMEQYIGTGADKIFKNNLSRRSLSFTGSGGSYFAILGKKAIFLSNFDTWDESRVALKEEKLVLIDDTMTVSNEYYCGEESVQKDAKDVVHGFKGQAENVILQRFLRNHLGMSDADAMSIENTSWISLKSCQTTDISGTEIKDDLTTTEAASSITATETSTDDSVDCGDSNEDLQTPPAGQNRQATSIDAKTPDGSETVSTPASYDTPTILEAN